MPLSDLRHIMIEDYYGPGFEGFQQLMKIRIRDVLLVSSLYDLYVFEEDGRLYELIRDEYKGMNLSHAPELTRVSSGEEALEMAVQERRFDLIITTPHIEDMHPTKFAQLVRDTNLNIPLVLLGYDNRELTSYLSHPHSALFDRIFVWQGDFRILIGIIKHLEDHLNLDHDLRTVGVQVILLIEDSVRYYSSFLPLIYTEIFKQSVRLISEGVNYSDRYLRMRARPKILLATNYEDATYYFDKYHEHLLGVISDVDFMCDGKQDPEAGIKFARKVKAFHDDMPVLLQSKRSENEAKAYDVGASFLLKDSPTLLNDLGRFMTDNFSFGDFVFRLPNGEVVGRAHDLVSLEKELHEVPEESIRYHAERNHFSSWLKARTEFWLASRFRATQVSEFDSTEDLRTVLTSALKEYRRARQRGVITDFKKETFDPKNSFARIGGGSLGGKARGLSFINVLLNNWGIYKRFKGIRIRVPPAVVLGTDVFDYFLEENNLREFALSDASDEEINERFLKATRFPKTVVFQLSQFLELIRSPLAVRSSSLLEDSQYHPFAGVYNTFMLTNNHHDSQERLHDLLNAIKVVYASTFYRHSKEYIKVTSYRLEEEKMAVIVQKMVGAFHRDRFYPDFSGVAKSHNFYPVPPQKATDGIISVALGLGKTVVEGGRTVKFVPRYPQNILQFATIEETLRNSQQDFYAVDLNAPPAESSAGYEARVRNYKLKVAEEDGPLFFVGSTYNHENHAVYDGLSRQGARLVTFAPVLKGGVFPLPEIAELLLEIGRKEMGTPVELEFAVTMTPGHGQPKEFGVLQMRPLVLSREMEQLSVNEVDPERILCRSARVLGNGVIEDIRDIVMVDIDRFDRARSREVAREVHQFNTRMVNGERPYLLIGVGRWGSMDPWLGIPVKWEQISGARVIIEAGLKDIDVEPSQGSHFFQNITSFMVGYFTIPGGNRSRDAVLDWEWLNAQPVEAELAFTRHIRLEQPLTVKMNGHKQRGVILKPGVEESPPES